MRKIRVHNVCCQLLMARMSYTFTVILVHYDIYVMMYVDYTRHWMSSGTFQFLFYFNLRLCIKLIIYLEKYSLKI